MHNQMADMLRKLGADASFPDIHHFASESFLTRPRSLHSFCAYCDRVNDLEENGENRQTIRRAIDFAERLQRRVPREQALAEAWTNYPLVTR